VTGLVVITGATGGVGQRVAQFVAERGGTPVIGHRPARAALASKLALSCKGLALLLDMADPSSIDRAVDTLAEDGRPVTGAVLAASPPPRLGPFGRISVEEHTLFWTTNVIGPQRLLAGLLRKFFRPHRKGTIVALLTKAMDRGSNAATSGMGAYIISKYGLEGVLALLKGECPWLEISTISPGFMETAMFETFDARFRDAVRARGEVADPRQVAEEIMGRFGLSDKEELDGV
jgi:3-oxoacyl-[acyl-carrier protein] reductase